MVANKALRRLQTRSLIRGGTRKNFYRGARVTFLGLKFDKLLFFGVAQNKSYFED